MRKNYDERSIQYSAWHGNRFSHAGGHSIDHLCIPDHSGDTENVFEKEKNAVQEPTHTDRPAAVQEATDEAEDLELVAVIAAAIAAYEQVPVDSFRVRTIKRRSI
ncbi:MAG: OadG family transporter subunit [Eubacterium sp.]